MTGQCCSRKARNWGPATRRGLCGVQKGVSDPLELELQAVQSAITRMLENKLICRGSTCSSGLRHLQPRGVGFLRQSCTMPRLALNSSKSSCLCLGLGFLTRPRNVSTCGLHIATELSKRSFLKIALLSLALPVPHCLYTCACPNVCAQC